VSTLTVITVTVALLVASAFFVMIEFALLGAKRHRLEDRAATSLAARAALRGMDELTVMLAAAQLGITACTFALGAVTKPAVSSWLTPVFTATGLPDGAAYTVSFVLALLVVTFLHLVIGEMAPKSWAIAFPDRAARLVSVPARALAWPLRPLLLWMNRVADRLVRWSGVEPVGRAAAGGHDTESLRHLVEHSAASGVLAAADRDRVIGALDLTRHRLADLPGTAVPELAADATVADVQDAARAAHGMRVVVPGDRYIHVRDTLTLSRETRVGAVDGLARPLLVLPPDLPAHEALRRMRGDGEQIIGVAGPGQRPRTVALPEILAVVLPGHPGT
jgi:CBS domain containing-hemolysin-like protein